MRISEFEARAFRNLRHVKFQPGDGVNFLLGNNAQGKTSILEAIDLLSGLKSFRGARTPELLRFGAREGAVRLRLDAGDGWTHQLDAEIKKDHPEADRAQRRFFVNGKPVHSAAEFFKGRFRAERTGFRTIVFCPSDHDLLRGEPELRRGFIDRAVASEALEAFESARRYARALEQRNEALKQAFRRRVADSEIEPFTEELLLAGSDGFAPLVLAQKTLRNNT
jgi:DNA replication and repair protein RecF